ncbi:MAG: hypothetical protein ACYS19_08625 [Planctomycetota bacterium]|jgi:hypothetical protein
MKLLFIGIIVGLSTLFTIGVELKRRRLLQRFWSRPGTGRQWKRRFPDASKDSIRDFLQEFVDAFGFSSKKRLKFSPDDKIMDVYESLYPSSWCDDSLEYVFLCNGLEQKYGFDLTEGLMDENITLGQLFDMPRNPKGDSVQLPRNSE